MPGQALNPMPCLFALAALAGARLLVSCDSPPRRPEPPPPPASSAADLLPAPDRLFQAVPALAIRATTTLEVRRGASVVTLRDDKDVRRLPSGDFDVTVRRVHQGSEAGDSEESFRAIRIGKDYFTRGSGGPFVQWDDALDEPARTLEAAAGESRAILAFLAPCLDERATPDGAAWTLTRPDCPLASAPDSAPMTATVLEVEGRLRRDHGRPAGVALSARLDVTAGGHKATAVLRHEAAFEPLPPDASVKPPPDAVSSRRDRPVRMVESVLSGLVTEWGPGAPRPLKEAQAAPGGLRPAEATGDSQAGP